MTRASELSYLIEIELLQNEIVEESQAISGKDLIKLLKRDAPLYIEWMGEEKFYKYLKLALTMSDNIKDPETAKFIERNCRNYIPLVRDSEIDPYNFKTYKEARYWMYNGKNKGWSFASGIDEQTIQMKNEGYPLKKIKNLSEVKTDDDFWGFVNTWLENNWRIHHK